MPPRRSQGAVAAPPWQCSPAGPSWGEQDRSAARPPASPCSRPPLSPPAWSLGAPSPRHCDPLPAGRGFDRVGRRQPEDDGEQHAATARRRWRKEMRVVEQRRLGSQGLVVSAEGLGCMGMSEFYGATDEDEAVATIHRALELGVTLLDTSDVYGPFTNERLVGRAVAGRRDRVIIATKFGNVRGEDGSWRGVNGRPDYVRTACDASLKRLGIDTHRPVLPAPRGQGDAHRGDRRGDGRAGARGQGALPRPLRGRAGARSAARTPSIRSARCRPSTHCGRGSRRRRSCRPCASWASGSSPTARSGAAS